MFNLSKFIYIYIYIYIILYKYGWILFIIKGILL